MKLQKQKAYKYKEKEHYKYTVIIPENLVSELKWKEGDELEGKAEGNTLQLRPQRKIT